MLAIGGILLGGAWSFHRQRNPLWTVIALALAGLVCVAVAFWRIQQGG
ncbi:hypothetical protein GCM10027268_24260 [Brachybacterium huguangmaarense]